MSIKLFVAEIEKLSRLQQNSNTDWTEIEDDLNRLEVMCSYFLFYCRSIVLTLWIHQFVNKILQIYIVLF